jgi:ribosomal protein L11 methylase PrmA
MGRKNIPRILVIYNDIVIENNFVIRTFDKFIDEIELKWHRDDEDRLINSIDESDWQIQLENELPKNIKNVFIKKHQWHRLIKGTNNLSIKIFKSNAKTIN